jgi:uncharacterized protein (DUF4213/DUF364 family)
MLKVKVENYEGITIFLREKKNIFFSAIINGIQKAWKNKLNRVEVAEFSIENSETIVNIDIDEEDWEESLYLALYYYEEIEEYEKCIEIKTLITNIYG